MAFEQLKERQSFVWGDAPFENVADTIGDVHEAVVAAVGPPEGKRWLDVACGTGELTALAGRTGAQVTGVDFAPALIETAKRLATGRGIDVDYHVGDAENLPFEDASFDVVTSSFGAMFAPDQERTAGELARVTTPGGRLVMANWTPEGTIGAMFRLTAQFAPPPPEGAGVPVGWGRRERVDELLGDAFELSVEPRVSDYVVSSGEEAWQVFLGNFGPVKALADSLEDDRREEFHQAWVDYFENFRDGDRVVQSREYLLVSGTRKFD
jgi:ubiquinone/menaquinone biosynthesis C-methylase UbiE